MITVSVMKELNIDHLDLDSTLRSSNYSTSFLFNCSAITSEFNFLNFHFFKKSILEIRIQPVLSSNSVADLKMNMEIGGNGTSIRVPSENYDMIKGKPLLSR